MGKARTYSEPTDYRQHAVRLRALKDNPRNPAELGAIGPQGDWAVDDPSAIVEEGSNSNGEYTIYANNTIKMHMTKIRAYSGVAFVVIMIYPVRLKSKKQIIYGANGTSSSVSLTPYYTSGEYTLSQFIAKGYEVNSSSSAGAVEINIEILGIC